MKFQSVLLRFAWDVRVWAPWKFFSYLFNEWRFFLHCIFSHFMIYRFFSREWNHNWEESECLPNCNFIFPFISVFLSIGALHRYMYHIDCRTMLKSCLLFIFTHVCTLININVHAIFTKHICGKTYYQKFYFI